MVKRFKDLSEQERLSLILNGADYKISGIIYGVIEDINDYKMFRKGNYLLDNPDRQLGVKILSLLEQLGYPMAEIGTYYYKRMILKTIKYLNVIEENETTMTNEDIINQLKNPYSQFYVEIAKNDLDIGIKTFHMYVGQANDEINYSIASESMLYNVYNGKLEDIDYGENAFLLATYMLGKRKKSPLIRRLSK